jgi:hypothetical protein
MSSNDTMGPIWVFDESRLEQALASYQAEALADYPHQQARIMTTVAAMRDFLHSEQAASLRMRLGKDQ